MARKARVRINPNLGSQVQQMLAPKIEAYQTELNQVLRDNAGKSVEEIKQALVEVTRRHGMKPNVEQLQNLAEQNAD